MGQRAFSDEPERIALARVEEALATFGIDASVAGQIPTTNPRSERAQALARKTILRRLGFEAYDQRRIWDLGESEREEYYRRRDATREGLAGSGEAQTAIGVLTYLLVHAAPSGDFGDVTRDLEEIDPDWRRQEGCREWLPLIADVALGSPDEDVRMGAVRALGEIGDPAAARPLLEALGRDASMMVRVTAASRLIPLAEELVTIPEAKAIIEEASDPKYFDIAANLPRHARKVLEKMGEAVADTGLEVDWATVVSEQITSRDVRAILDRARDVGAGVVLRFFGPAAGEPSPETIGPLLALFERDAQVAAVHGGAPGHLLARAEMLATVAREEPAVASYPELVEALRGRGWKVGGVASVVF